MLEFFFWEEGWETYLKNPLERIVNQRWYQAQIIFFYSEFTRSDSSLIYAQQLVKQTPTVENDKTRRIRIKIASNRVHERQALIVMNSKPHLRSTIQCVSYSRMWKLLENNNYTMQLLHICLWNTKNLNQIKSPSPKIVSRGIVCLLCLLVSLLKLRGDWADCLINDRKYLICGRKISSFFLRP